ncbi:unnamed protein product [Bursaphelenchus xylophilus]|uniref:(pine wood nematode) hypothetical protein n=1 Tax=Bursaphelenchus xylophilus TaxID=6326 RepID=A0A1I7S292_BURXY|nr:unnamed protein product [Bursaphelenchus xylophilus]CAG9114787.1 unnamed protein product [Bursaphelenchus xylophilus]
MHFKSAILFLVVAVTVNAQYQRVIDPATWNYAMSESNKKECTVHKNQSLHVVMDRICELCHEMFSHENPNFRSQCIANCFKTWVFRSCLNVFKPY